MACLFVIVRTDAGRKSLLQIRSRKKSMGGVLQPAVHGKREHDDRTPVGLLLREIGEGEGGGFFLRDVMATQWQQMPALAESPGLVAFAIELTQGCADRYQYHLEEASGILWVGYEEVLTFRTYVKERDYGGVAEGERVMMADHLTLLTALLMPPD